MRKKTRLLVMTLAVFVGLFLCQLSHTTPVKAGPHLAVGVDADFTKISEVCGYQWLPGTTAYLDIDSGNDGSVDYSDTSTVTDAGEVFFFMEEGLPVNAGDKVTMYDDLGNSNIHFVEYLTLDEIDFDTNTLRGQAYPFLDQDPDRRLHTRVHESGYEGPDVEMTDVCGGWCATFCQIDIVQGSRGWVMTRNINGSHTAIHWFACTDTDRDGICDDGDGSGIAGDYPCTGGEIVNCDDNCVDTPNEDQADLDVDGIGDACDRCPEEDSTGFDADGDGCIDSLSGLSNVIDTLLNSGVIDETMGTALKQKVENAEKSGTKENICAAVNQLEAFKNQVEAQKGKEKISGDAAALLIGYADNVIANLLSNLPPGESC
jgi:hypothetical protein